MNHSVMRSLGEQLKAGISLLAAAMLMPGSALAATLTIVENRNINWTQTVTLPDYAPDSKLVAKLRIINAGDPWDRAGRVWVDTPAGRCDLFSLVTGFGGTYWNDDVDISALRPFLRGRVTFGGNVDQSGWKMTLQIVETPGGNKVNQSIWAGRLLGSNTVWDDGEGDAGPRAYGFTIPSTWPAAMFSKVYLTFFASGHGSMTGGCEFNTGTFRLWADGTTVLTADPWRNASDKLRSRNPTSGRTDGNGDGDTTDAYPTDRWSSDYARSGWLPGDYVRPYVIDITSKLGTIPGGHTISYDYLDNIGTKGGYWVLSSYVNATANTAAPLADTLVNGGFETNSGASYDSTVDGWMEHEVYGGAGPGGSGCGIWAAGAASVIPGTSGDQLSLIAGDTSANTSTVIQFLGAVRSADIGKTMTLRAGAAAWDWSAAVKPFSGTVTLSFRTGALGDPFFSYGTLLGTAGSVTTGVTAAGDGIQNGIGDDGGLRNLTATFTPSPADVGKQVFAVINLGNVTMPPAGENRFIVDDVQMEVEPSPNTIFMAEKPGSSWAGFANGVPDLSNTDYLNGRTDPFTLGTGSTWHAVGANPSTTAGRAVLINGVGSTTNNQTIIVGDSSTGYVRLLIDLQAGSGQSLFCSEFNSYSMVTSDSLRHYQIYDLYGSNAVSAPGWQVSDGDPAANGWKPIASVNTIGIWTKATSRTGGVSIQNINAPYRYLLFHAKTDPAVNRGNHYVELDASGTLFPPCPYGDWIGGHFPGVTDSSIIGPKADPDGDGVENGIEFLTGTNPDDGTSHNAPEIVRNGDGDLVVTFGRTDAAETSLVHVEHSTTLQPESWTRLPVPNDAITGPPVTVADNGTAPDSITVVVPANGAPNKFARVAIDIP